MEVGHIKVGHALLKSLATLREQKGDFSLEDVWVTFKQVSASPPAATEADHFMHKEIAQLAHNLAVVKKEICNFATPGQPQAAVTDAPQHLSEVVRALEKATHAIMDAADVIQAAAIGAGEEKEKTIRDATTRIYEACNFQDISGQHITKVIKMLNALEMGINRLNALVAEGQSAQSAPDTKPGSVASLLNGPQFAAQAPTQEDIDTLFETLNAKP